MNVPVFILAADFEAAKGWATENAVAAQSVRYVGDERALIGITVGTGQPRVVLLAWPKTDLERRERIQAALNARAAERGKPAALARTPLQLRWATLRTRGLVVETPTGKWTDRAEERAA